MTDFTEYDVVVIGGGPAGLVASVAASETGGRVLLIDGGIAGGGQVYRNSGMPEHSVYDKYSSEKVAGDALRHRLASSNVEQSFQSTVWKVTRDRRVFTIGPAGKRNVIAGSLIVATGAKERVIPFDGWTLPGVIGVGAAINFLKADWAVPSGRTVIAGVGPLLYAAATKILDLGGKVAAIADLSTSYEWCRRLPAMLNRIDLLWQGAKWIAAIRRRGVPIYHQHTVVAAEGDDCLSRVHLAPLRQGRQGEPTASISIDADCLCVGHGLQPNTEITRLIGARHCYVPDQGGWIPVRDDRGQTTIPHVFVAGDVAGIRGATVAELEGEQVGLTAGEAAGLEVDQALQQKYAAGRHALKRSLRFGWAIADVMRPRLALLDAIGPDTLICRCEEVTRSEIETATREAVDLNWVKRLTRCGMGPCQGRYCGDTVGMLLSRCSGKSIAELGYWTSRDPLFPIEIDIAVGDTGYEAIALPTPLPD